MLSIVQVCGGPSKVGVREGRDERDRRPRHPPLLRLTLPHGTGEREGATTLKISQP